MNKPVGWHCKVADSTVSQGTNMALQFKEFDRIIIITAGGDGMRAVMASFAIQAAMAGGLAI